MTKREQRRILRHMLGLDIQRESFRNYYAANRDYKPHMEKLEAIRLVEMYKCDRYDWYRCTAAGIEAAK